MEAKPHVVIELPVQWGDMDALGHVNNTRFFTWFESARIALFEKIGVSSAGPSSVAPILATTTCNYVAPLHYPAPLRVSARCTKVGETSLTMEYEVASGGRVHARGSSVAVLVDYGSSAKVRVPDAVRAAIDALDAG
jgi:acyl-CoA thioester hydrolase